MSQHDWQHYKRLQRGTSLFERSIQRSLQFNAWPNLGDRTDEEPSDSRRLSSQHLAMLDALLEATKGPSSDRDVVRSASSQSGRRLRKPTSNKAA